jgi:NADH-quinone oxidoreductase subunit E
MIPVDLSLAEHTLARYPKEPRHLISVLQDLQIAYRYLPREALELTSEALDVPLAKVYGVATFYKAFSLTPKGETVLRVCTGTACHIRGAPLILGELETRLGICAGETTEDLSFSLEAVNCVGACALAPVIVANDSAHGNVTVTKARRLVKREAADNDGPVAAQVETAPTAGDESVDDAGRGSKG